MAGKGRLKAALARHEAKAAFKSSQDSKVHKQKIAEAAQKEKRRKHHQTHQSQWIPFDQDSTLCLIGEGDFSFAAAVLDSNMASKVIATGLDSKEETIRKYGNEMLEHLEKLYDEDAIVLHEVDATCLGKIKSFKKALDGSSGPSGANGANGRNGSNGADTDNVVIMFNFPHLGNSVSDLDRNIRQHQELLVAFFKQTVEHWPKAKVVVTLFDGQPYESWELKRLARMAGYRLLRSGRFNFDQYPGYHHQLTGKGGASTSKSQKDRLARSFQFTAVPTDEKAVNKQQDQDSE